MFKNINRLACFTIAICLCGYALESSASSIRSVNLGKLSSSAFRVNAITNYPHLDKHSIVSFKQMLEIQGFKDDVRFDRTLFVSYPEPYKKEFQELFIPGLNSVLWRMIHANPEPKIKLVKPQVYIVTQQSPEALVSFIDYAFFMGVHLPAVTFIDDRSKQISKVLKFKEKPATSVEGLLLAGSKSARRVELPLYDDGYGPGKLVAKMVEFEKSIVAGKS